MIFEHKKLNLFGKKAFEILIVRPPFSKSNLMDSEACFLHLIEGHSITISETDRIALEAKESVLMKCGNYISNMLPSKSEKYFHSFSVHFHLDVLEKIYQKELPPYLISNKNSSLNSFLKVENKPLISNFIEGMMLYFQNPALVNEDLLIVKLKELILLLYQGDESDAIRTILTSLFSHGSYTIRQVVEAHLYTNISVNELASLCNMSLSTFKREFSKIFKDSTANYLKTQKLEKAKELLDFSDKRINEIAFECGFNDLSHFSKSFVRKYGKSPSDYRLN